jgi:hypothetical protein
LGNIEPKDRKIPISIGLPASLWERIDDCNRTKYNGRMNRSQFMEKQVKLYLDELEKENNQNASIREAPKASQIIDYLEIILERFLHESQEEEIRQVLPVIRRSYQLAQNHTGKVKHNIKDITDRNPLEKLRLDTIQIAKEYRALHENLAPESISDNIPSMDVEEVELKRLGESIGNDISKPFKTRQSKKEQKPNQEIIENEIPNPYGEGETIFQ